VKSRRLAGALNQNLSILKRVLFFYMALEEDIKAGLVFPFSS
jgi:hypothetical protein